MPYDAFGNKIGGDPLSGIGGTGTGQGMPNVPGDRPPRRVGRVIAVVLTVAVLLVAGAAAIVFVVAGDDESASPAAGTEAREPTPEAPAPEAPAEPDPEPAADPDPEQPAAPVEPPTGLQPGSLLRRANFIVALRRLRAEAKGRPRNVRVEAQRVDIQLLLQDGRLRSAQATWDGEVRVFSTTPTPVSGLEAFSWSQIDRSAPQRLVRSATGRAKKPASAFNYAVMLDIGGPHWSAFLKTGEAFSANGSGRIERQISG